MESCLGNMSISCLQDLLRCTSKTNIDKKVRIWICTDQKITQRKFALAVDLSNVFKTY